MSKRRFDLIDFLAQFNPRDFDVPLQKIAEIKYDPPITLENGQTFKMTLTFRDKEDTDEQHDR